MERWDVGDVRITKVVEAEVWFPIENMTELLPGASPAEIAAMRWLQPHYVRDGETLVGYYSFLIETADRKIVVDTAVGNAKPRAAERFNMLDTAYLENFRQVWEPSEVDAVICTHLHVDHVGWNTRLDGAKWVPTFPNATYHFVQREYDHWKRFADNDEMGLQIFEAATVFRDGSTRRRRWTGHLHRTLRDDRSRGFGDPVTRPHTGTCIGAH
jgi:glyoxylase-like metal-dependent hydrolase (beta-lactamase superfamily II)